MELFSGVQFFTVFAFQWYFKFTIVERITFKFTIVERITIKPVLK